MDKKLLSLNGVFAVLKPAGETSSATVERLKRVLLRTATADNNDRHAFKRLAKTVKVGHGGTLDPMATGILVIGLNGGCKRLSTFLSGKKTYVAEGRFGEHFDTLDCTGKCLIKDDGWKENGALERVSEVLSRFCGQPIMQRPPAFSAIHLNGVRAHELARKHVDSSSSASLSSDLKKEPFELPERPVNVYDLKYSILDHETGLFQLEIDCGGGCYVRSLIRDLAGAVDSVATMTALKRIRQGVFTEDHCLLDSDFPNFEAIAEAIKRSEALLK